MKRQKNIYKAVMCIGIVAVLITLLLTGCGNESSEKAHLADPFIPIEVQEEQGLVYNRQSKTVYVLFNESAGYRGYGYMDLYIVNGHTCEYRDNKIVEVIPNYEYVDGKIIEIEPTYKEVDIDIVGESVDDKWNALTEEEKKELLEGK